ncbi:MAG: alanyl-tRNA editing protein [Actinomycetota bacterium]
MTERLYSTDAYLDVCDARVSAVTPLGIVLDRTVAYARGGGQPGDTGVLTTDAGDLAVLDTFVDRASGELIHALAEDSAAPDVGAAVRVAIDAGRRRTIMRTHTALHALSGIVFTHFGAKVTGGNMEADGTARMDFELDSISQEFGRDVEERLNAALAGAHAVNVLFLPRAEALADPALIRTKANLIPAHVDPIRVIDIEGIDKQADGGTHVRSTLEVGHVAVVKTESKGKANKRMRILLDGLAS